MARSGWTDLCLTFADAGLSIPPIPKPHRKLLVKRAEWFWSTRADVEAFKMYMFEYVTELLTSSVSDYSAISHAGHGANSYGLNVSIVKGPVAIAFQHAWAGVYSLPRRDLTDIAASFWEMREVLKAAEGSPEEEKLYHILAWSEFREVADYYAKDSNEQWIKHIESGRRPHVAYSGERGAGDIADEDLGAACRRFLANLTMDSPSKVSQQRLQFPP